MSDIVPASEANSSKQSMTSISSPAGHVRRPWPRAFRATWASGARPFDDSRTMSSISKPRGLFEFSRLHTIAGHPAIGFPERWSSTRRQDLCSPAGRPISDNTWAASGISRPRGRTGFSSGPGGPSVRDKDAMGGRCPTQARARSTSARWFPSSDLGTSKSGHSRLSEVTARD